MIRKSIDHFGRRYGQGFTRKRPHDRGGSSSGTADCRECEVHGQTLRDQEEIERCKLIGIKPPEPVPHPDHIKIDLSTGKVRITGPFTREEKVKRDKLKKRKASAIKAIKTYEEDLEDPGNEKYREFIESEIAFERRILGIVSTVVKD